ncbi:MAG: hypothetical protein ACJAUU_001168, partial [Rickettsiales bacterium]
MAVLADAESGSTLSAGGDLNLFTGGDINSDGGSFSSGKSLNLVAMGNVKISDTNNVNRSFLADFLNNNPNNSSGSNAGSGSKSLFPNKNLSLSKSLISSKSPFFANESSPSIGNASANNASLLSASSLKDDAILRRSASSFNAGTDIQIVSGGDVNIANNQFNAGGSIFLNAANDVNNSNFVIDAGNDVVISAARNVNNIATIAGVKSGKTTKINAGKM